MKLDDAQWEQIKSLFESALDHKPETRTHFLDLTCSQPEIKKQVLRLLAYHQEMGNFLSREAYAASPGQTIRMDPKPTFFDGQLVAKRFRIKRYVARGGMGEVYEAFDCELDSPVAVKSIRADLLNDRMLQQFKAEVQLAKQVTHSNICRVYDLFRHDGDGCTSTLLISMELLDGETLAQRLQHGSRLTCTEALPIVSQIATALDAAHGAGIIHSDLKPENVMLVPANGGSRAVVMDFGIALRMGLLSGSTVPALAGTPAYMSPEQLDGSDLTPASDIYSLGLLMYRMLTGQHAFQTAPLTFESVARFPQSIQPPRRLVADLNRRWERVIVTCLRREPAKRYRSALLVVYALNGSNRRSVIRYRTAFYALAAAACLVIALALTYFYRTSISTGNATEEQTAHSSLVEGFRHIETGDLPAAKAILEREIRQEPDFGPAHAALAAALWPMGYENRAREESKRARALITGLKRQDALFVMGIYHEATQNWRDAAKVFETLSAVAPEKPEWSIRYALALAQIGRQKDAFEVIAKVRSAAMADGQRLRVDLAEALVAEFANDDSREVKLAASAEQSAVASGLSYQAGHAELLEAWAFYHLSEFTDAQAKAAAARAKLSRIGDAGGQAQAWKIIGDIDDDQGRHEPAVSAYRKAITTFHNIGSTRGEAVTLNNLGYTLKDAGDLQGARASFARSLLIARMTNDLKIQSRALNGTGIVLERMENLSGAAQTYADGIKIAKELSDNSIIAAQTENLGIVLSYDGELGKARTNYVEAMDLFHELGRQVDVAGVLGNLGYVELRAGQLDAAAARFSADTKLARAIPSATNIARGLLGLSQVYLLKGDLKHARSYVNDCLKITKTLHEAGTIAEALLVRAEIDLHEKAFKAAAAAGQNAATEFANEKQPDLVAAAQAVEAESLVGEHRPLEAIILAESAFKILSSSEDKTSQIDAKLHLWKSYEAVGRRDVALNLLNSAIADAERFNYVPQLLEARLSVAELHFRSADPTAKIEIQNLGRDARFKGFLFLEREASAAFKQDGKSKSF